MLHFENRHLTNSLDVLPICFPNLVPNLVHEIFTVWEIEKERKKSYRSKTFFTNFEFRIYEYFFFNWQTGHYHMSIHKVSTNIFPTTHFISSRVTKMHTTQTGTYLLIVLYFKGDEPTQKEKHHSQTVTSACNVFSLDYTFFPTRRLVCYVSHYGAFF